METYMIMIEFLFSMFPDDIFPMLDKLHEAREQGGGEAVDEILNHLSESERRQLNLEVSMIINGVPGYSDPHVDYLRMRKYMEN